MSAAALLVHATRGRARLRLPAVKGDASFFRRLEEELRKVAGVTDVKVNANTASVLVRHGGDFDVVARHARAQGLFELREREEPRATEARGGLSRHARTLEEIELAIRDADDSLRRRTNGAVDLQTLAFGALLTGSAYQLWRGKFLPAGGAMLAQAMGLLFGSTRGED